MKSKSKNFNDRKIEKLLEVEIQKIVPGGYGLAFAENLTVFVSLAAVGDLLRVRVRERKGKVAFAEIVEIIQQSETRAKPECPYFGVCGGCDFQHLSYAAQLEAKAAIVRDCLTRIGKIDYAAEISIVGSPHDYRYRSRAQWHVDGARSRIGYFKRHSHDIVDVETCPILEPKLEETLSDFRARIKTGELATGAFEIETACAGESVSIYSNEILETTEEISFAAKDNRYFYDAERFFQGNQFLIEPLIEAATEGAGGDRALDLFCGVGLFTLPLAHHFKTVAGVEASREAIRFANRNAAVARLENVEFFDAGVDDWLTENAAEKFDFVLLDPPRAGAGSEVTQSLLKMRPPEISYVSCDPATLARDLRVLGESYSIERLVALDLFPQTHHVETVVRLKLKN